MIRIDQRPAEMVHEQRFVHEPFKMGPVTDNEARQIGVYVRVLGHHFSSVHHPGITQMTDHEVHSTLLIGQFIYGERMRILQQSVHRVGISGMDHHGQAILGCQLIDRGIDLVMDIMMVISGIQLDSRHLGCLHPHFDPVKLRLGLLPGEAVWIDADTFHKERGNLFFQIKLHWIGGTGIRKSSLGLLRNAHSDAENNVVLVEFRLEAGGGVLDLG
ncbi:hypothetical protein D3C75_732470 [compost metagenome]